MVEQQPVMQKISMNIILLLLVAFFSNWKSTSLWILHISMCMITENQFLTCRSWFNVLYDASCKSLSCITVTGFI